MRHLVAYVVASFVILTILYRSGRELSAGELPSYLELRNSLTFFDKPGTIPTGIGSLEIGPDGKIWLFASTGDIQTLDSVDGVFFNGNDVLSVRFGSTDNGAVFTPDGQLLSYDNFSDTASLRDAVDGIFFNGDDAVTDFTWPFGVLNTGRGDAEPVGGAFGLNGIFYVNQHNNAAGVPQRMHMYDPIDGNLSNDNFSFATVDLPAEFGRPSRGVAFDSYGNMFISTLNDVLVGIDPVDGIFFNGDDVSRVYAWGSILAGVSSPRGDPGIADIAFDQQGNLIVFDSGTEMLHALTPIFDSDGDAISDDEDTCQNSNLNDTVVIDGCDSGVDNTLFMDGEDFGNGCTIADLILELAENAENHGKFVSGVTELMHNLQVDGIITGKERGAIQRCAAQANIP